MAVGVGGGGGGGGRLGLVSTVGFSVCGSLVFC